MTRKARTPATPPRNGEDSRAAAGGVTQSSPGEAPTFFTLPLFSLVLSDLNVRHTERDADIAALAEDIAAIGLLQPLLVVPAHFSTAETTENYGDKFEVIGGGRRVQALKLLAEAGRLPHDHPVPVTVRARDDARTVSLSENLHRVAMNPADEFEAFAAIVAQNVHAGQTAEAATAACAKRFGVTERHVRERLRLATLAPEILDALRGGRIGLDSAKAYAGTEDHKLQVKVFNSQVKQSWKKHDPREVRESLRGMTLPLSDGRVKFVGLDAYRAAGGRTEVEMFMGTDGAERVINIALLDKLCAEKAGPLLDDQAKADGYKSGVFAPGCGWRCRTPKPPKDYVNVQYEYSTVPKKALKERIAVYTVADDGSGLKFAGKFKPVSEDKDIKKETFRTQTPEERAAIARQNRVDLWAARIAVGAFAGSPLDGKAFWPRGLVGTDQPAGDGSEDMLVTVQIRVTAEQIEAAREAAIAKVDAIEAEEAERAAAKAAEQETRDAEADEEAEEDAAMDNDEVEA